MTREASEARSKAAGGAGKPAPSSPRSHLHPKCRPLIRPHAGTAPTQGAAGSSARPSPPCAGRSGLTSPRAPPPMKKGSGGGRVPPFPTEPATFGGWVPPGHGITPCGPSSGRGGGGGPAPPARFRPARPASSGLRRGDGGPPALPEGSEPGRPCSINPWCRCCLGVPVGSARPPPRGSRSPRSALPCMLLLVVVSSMAFPAP